MAYSSKEKQAEHDRNRKLYKKGEGPGAVICRCGGKIELYATELGTCNRCRHDFFVYTYHGEKVARILADHRRDLA